MASSSGGMPSSRCNGRGKRIPTRRSSYKLHSGEGQTTKELQPPFYELQAIDRTHPDRPTQPSATVFRRDSFQEHDLIDQTDGSYRYPFTCLDFIVTIGSTLFFLYDFISDVVLAEEYFRHGRLLAFWFTAAFTAVPALISNGMSVQWYYLDYCRQKIHPHAIPTSVCTWFCRVFFTIPLMMGPAVR